GEIAHTLDRFLAPFADNVRRTEIPGQCDPVRVTTEHDDLLGAQPARGDDATQTHGAVADDSHSLAGADLRRPGRVVAGSHDVREREQRRHQRVIPAYRQHDERPVRLGNPHGLALAAIEVAAPPPAVETRRLQPLVAEDAGPVGPGERSDDEVARLDGADLSANRLDDADELVAHAPPLLARLHRLVGPEIAAADAGPGDGEKRIGRLDDPRVGDGLDPNVAGAVHDSCSHGETTSRSSGPRVRWLCRALSGARLTSPPCDSLADLARTGDDNDVSHAGSSRERFASPPGFLVSAAASAPNPPLRQLIVAAMVAVRLL